MKLTLIDEEDDIAIFAVDSDDANNYYDMYNSHIPCISADSLVDYIPMRNKPVIAYGYPEYNNDRSKPSQIILSAGDKLNEIFANDGSGKIDQYKDQLELTSHQIHNKLNGMSGGPVFTVTEDKMGIVGVCSGQADFKTFNLFVGEKLNNRSGRRQFGNIF